MEDIDLYDDITDAEREALHRAHARNRQKAEEAELLRAHRRIASPQVLDTKPKQNRDRPRRKKGQVVESDAEGYIPLSKLKKLAYTGAAILSVWGAHKIVSAEKPASTKPVIEAVFASNPDHEIVYDRERNMEIARELNVPALYELISDAPNIEAIRHNSFFSMQCTPGDYDGPLRADSWEDVYQPSLAAESRHQEGVDSRTLIENKILADLLQHRYPDVSRSIIREDSTKIANGLVSSSATHRYEQLSDSLVTASEQVSPGDLLMFLQVAGSQHSRERALEVLFEMAQDSLMIPYGIAPLDGNKIAVANQFGRAPELYLWVDALAPVMTLLFNAAPDIMYEGTHEDAQKRLEAVNQYGAVIEPEYIYAVLMTETNGGKYIGDAPFLSQNNSLYDIGSNGEKKWWFPTSEADMQAIAERIEQEYGLPMTQPFERAAGVTRYTWQYIPGSLRRTFKSGGAVGPQALPIMLQRMMEKHDEARLRLHEQTGLLLPPMLFMAPTGMVEVSYIYTASYWRHIQGDGNGNKSFAHFKGGALPGNLTSARRAMESWNPYKPQVDQVMRFYSQYAGTTEINRSNLRAYHQLIQHNQSGSSELAAKF